MHEHEDGVPKVAPLRHIVWQHAEEAASLWMQRRRAVRQPHYDLQDLAKLDGRVEAHLDGLRIAGGEGWELLKENLERGEAGEVFTAAVLALEQGDAIRFQLVVEAVKAKPERVAGLVSALGWVSWDKARGPISELLRSDNPLRIGAGLRGCAVNRQHPGPVLEAALRAKQPAVTAQAARAAGELGRIELLALLEWHLGGKDEEPRFWAAWAGALLGSRKAPEALAAIAGQGGPRAEQAAATAARTMEPKTRNLWLAALSQNAAQARQAAVAAGASGDPAWIPWLLEAMGEPKVARAAGEAFSLITGVDLAYEDLEGEKPEDFEAGPTDDPEDENVAPDPDENLPWPDAGLVSGWWQQQKPKYAPGRRYLAGRPLTRENLLVALREAKQRQRIAAAEELKLLDPRQGLFECRAPGARQLGEMRGIVSTGRAK